MKHPKSSGKTKKIIETVKGQQKLKRGCFRKIFAIKQKVFLYCKFQRKISLSTHHSSDS